MSDSPPVSSTGREPPLPQPTRLDGLFVGRAGTTLGDGTPSGMIKFPARDPCQLGASGFADDYHADRASHGGADKAVHHYPAAHYGLLAQHFERVAETLAAGAMGENLSSAGLDETCVCIGDVFRVGNARLQVTQPRRPCWKIDRRFDADGMAAYVVRTGITGWYYRVLEPGTVVAGAEIALIERDPQPVSVREFHELTRQSRPDTGRLAALARIAALPAGLSKRLADRVAWLNKNA